MGVEPTGGHPAMDYVEHRKTYKVFLRLLAALALTVVVVLVGMLYFLV